MGRLGNIKPVEVKVRLEDYIHLVLGEGKTGKSTLFRDLINIHYKGDMSKGLLLAFEPGFNALDGLYAEQVEDWEDWDLWVDDLVDNKKTTSFKFIAIDTIDKFVDMAIDKTLRESKRRDGKPVSSINEAMGGFQRGRDYCLKIMDDSLAKLKNAQFGIFLIGHTKLKKKNTGVTLSDGQEYMQLSSNLMNEYEAIFKNLADMMTFLVVNKEVTGDITNVKKRTSINSVNMHFRSNGEIDCGGRLKGLPLEPLEYSAENYLKAFEQGVKASILKPITEKDIQKMAEKQEKESDIKAEINSQKISIVDMVIKVKKEYPSLGDGAKIALQQLIEDVKISSLDELTEEHRDTVEKMFNLVS